MSGVIVGIAAFGIALFVLDCWTALVPPRGFHALPGWARLLLPLTFAAAALRESNRGQRSVFVASAVTFVLILYPRAVRLRVLDSSCRLDVLWVSDFHRCEWKRAPTA